MIFCNSKSVLDIFKKEHRLELAERVVEALENCPGTCKYCGVAFAEASC